MSPISGNGLCLFISWPLFFLLFCFLNFHERRQHVWWSGMKRKAESRLADCVSPALMKRMLQWLQQSAEEETRSSGDCQQPNDLQCLLRRLARNANYHILTLVCDSVSVRTRGCSCSATLSVSAVMTSPNSRSAEGRWGCVTCSRPRNWYWAKCRHVEMAWDQNKKKSEMSLTCGIVGENCQGFLTHNSNCCCDDITTTQFHSALYFKPVSVHPCTHTHTPKCICVSGNMWQKQKQVRSPCNSAHGGTNTHLYDNFLFTSAEDSNTDTIHFPFINWCRNVVFRGCDLCSLLGLKGDGVCFPGGRSEPPVAERWSGSREAACSAQWPLHETLGQSLSVLTICLLYRG